MVDQEHLTREQAVEADLSKAVQSYDEALESLIASNSGQSAGEYDAIAATLAQAVMPLLSSYDQGILSQAQEVLERLSKQPPLGWRKAHQILDQASSDTVASALHSLLDRVVLGIAEQQFKSARGATIGSSWAAETLKFASSEEAEDALNIVLGERLSSGWFKKFKGLGGRALRGSKAGKQTRTASTDQAPPKAGAGENDQAKTPPPRGSDTTTNGKKRSSPFMSTRTINDLLSGQFGSTIFENDPEMQRLRDQYRKIFEDAEPSDPNYYRGDTPFKGGNRVKEHPDALGSIIDRTVARYPDTRWLKSADKEQLHEVVRMVRSARQEAGAQDKPITDKGIYVAHRRRLDVESLDLSEEKRKALEDTAKIMLALMGGKPSGKFLF